MISPVVPRERAFYPELFGWESRVMPMPLMESTVFSNAGVDIAGMMPILPHMEGIAPQWGTYFRVNQVDDTTRLAEELGGRICLPPTDIAGIGRFSAIASPRGVLFYAITYLPRRAAE